MADQLPDANVAHQENNGFGPFSKPRGRAAVIASVVVVIIFGLILVFSVRERGSKEGIQFLVFSAALLTLSVVIGELVRRMCLVIEEVRHKKERYQGNWKHVFRSTFAFGNGSSIIFVTVVSALFVCFALYEHYEVFSHPDYAILFAVNCFLVPQLVFLVGVRELSSVEISEINEKENKNVADGLAWSYYFGYLKLVLPRLEDQITKSTEFRYKITKKKLFILLPKTCYTYDSIVKADNRVKCVGSLPEYLTNRAGIQARSYKHSVHRIEMPSPDGRMKEYHFILEYATPLMSLYDMSMHADASLTRQERDHQVVYLVNSNLQHTPCI